MSPKAVYHNLVIDVSTGEATQVTVTVYAATTTESSTIYSDSAGTAKSNPFATDINGRFSFYANPGEYDIQVSGAAINTYTLEDVSIVGTSQEVIITQPTTGEYRIKELRMNTDNKGVIVTHSDTPEA